MPLEQKPAQQQEDRYVPPFHPTQREYFAAAAVMSLNESKYATLIDMAGDAVAVADALIRELEGRE